MEMAEKEQIKHREPGRSFTPAKKHITIPKPVEIGGSDENEVAKIADIFQEE